jgi:hypothetical protein
MWRVICSDDALDLLAAIVDCIVDTGVLGCDAV